MKTILHIIDTTGPGGAETVFIDLATRLPKDIYQPVVLIRGKGWVYEELCRRGIAPIILDAKGSFNWRYLKNIRNIIKDYNIDLIQTHLLGASVYGSLAGLTTRTPVIATFHGLVDIGEKERLKSLKIGAINIGANKVVAVSRDLQNDIINRTRLSKDKTTVIYNGIKTSDFNIPHSDELRNKLGLGKDDFVIGCLGNIRPAKGYHILLEAASQIVKNNDHVRFVIAGQPDNKGDLYKSLLQQRQELGLEDRVYFLGFLDNPAAFLASLDLFLSSSISEGLPLSAIQAMASGVPLLATRCGGYEELVTDKVNGWLVESNNAGALAAGIEALLEEPETRQLLSQQARKHATQIFDIDVMLESYKMMYKDILEKSN